MLTLSQTRPRFIAAARCAGHILVSANPAIFCAIVAHFSGSNKLVSLVLFWLFCLNFRENEIFFSDRRHLREAAGITLQDGEGSFALCRFSFSFVVEFAPFLSFRQTWVCSPPIFVGSWTVGIAWNAGKQINNIHEEGYGIAYASRRTDIKTESKFFSLCSTNWIGIILFLRTEDFCLRLDLFNTRSFFSGWDANMKFCRRANQWNPALVCSKFSAAVLSSFTIPRNLPFLRACS